MVKIEKSSMVDINGRLHKKFKYVFRFLIAPVVSSIRYTKNRQIFVKKPVSIIII